jgi:hypothetical protein
VLELNDHLLRDIGLERSQLTAAAYGRLNAAQRRAAACGQLGEGPLHMKKVSPAPTVDHAALVERLVIAGQESRR